MRKYMKKIKRRNRRENIIYGISVVLLGIAFLASLVVIIWEVFNL